MDELILDACGRLDPSNDDHWTKTGLPKLGALRALMGVSDLKVEDLHRAAPGFTREQAMIERSPVEPPVEAVAEATARPEAPQVAPPVESAPFEVFDATSEQIEAKQKELVDLTKLVADITERRKAILGEIELILAARPLPSDENDALRMNSEASMIRKQAAVNAGLSPLSPLDQSLRARGRQRL